MLKAFDRLTTPPPPKAGFVIRAALDLDHEPIWKIFREVVATGDTYPLDPATSRENALGYWFQQAGHVYVAEANGATIGLPCPSPIIGTYLLRPNQSGGGAHVANAAFMVAPRGQGQGVGRAMAEHCFQEARRLGFRVMQFNFVVSANKPAVKLWLDFGMKIVGTLPGAFRHPTKGYVDVFVMFRSLTDEQAATCKTNISIDPNKSCKR